MIFKLTEAELAAIQARIGGARAVKPLDSAPARSLASLPQPKKPKRVPLVPGRKLGRPRKGEVRRKERDVQAACIDILESHPSVKLHWRQNTGAARHGGRFIKFSFTGASDLMGVLCDGRFLACECKSTGELPSDDQRAFLDNVTAAGGLALCVDDPKKLVDALESWWIRGKYVPRGT